MTPRDRTASGRFRVLVIANETAADDALHDLVADHIGDMPAEVLVVAPAAASRRARIESVDAARARIDDAVSLAHDVAVQARRRFGLPTSAFVSAREPAFA